eukprot:1354171-Alexandrium_andersonii.AAC.1
MASSGPRRVLGRSAGLASTMIVGAMLLSQLYLWWLVCGVGGGWASWQLRWLGLDMGGWACVGRIGGLVGMPWVVGCRLW